VADSFKLTTTGIRELDQLFTTLRSGQQRAVMLSNFRKASKPLIKQTRVNYKTSHSTTSKSGTYKSIGSSARRRSAALRVGARVAGRYKGYHAHILDQGTKERFRTTKSGRRVSTGKITGSKFFTKAVTQTQPQVQELDKKEFYNTLTAYIQRFNKRKSKQK